MGLVVIIIAAGTALASTKNKPVYIMQRYPSDVTLRIIREHCYGFRINSIDMIMFARKKMKCSKQSLRIFFPVDCIMKTNVMKKICYCLLYNNNN